MKKAKKAKEALASGTLRGHADRLRSAIDRAAFTKSALWRDFVADANELHAVVLRKVQSMQVAAEEGLL